MKINMGSVKHKVIRRTTAKKIAEKEYGLTNVTIYYSKEEGWWIECDQIDNWICMDSGGIRFGLDRLTKNLKKQNVYSSRLRV
jgi:hypothetical protein